MKGTPPARYAQISDMQVIIKCVDQRGRELDQHWGIGRLPMLVPIEWAERFCRQYRCGAVGCGRTLWRTHGPEPRGHGAAADPPAFRRWVGAGRRDLWSEHERARTRVRGEGPAACSGSDPDGQNLRRRCPSFDGS